MDEDLYPSDSSGEDESPQEESSDAEGFLAPMDSIPQEYRKAGATFTVRVTHLYDDEAELTIV